MVLETYKNSTPLLECNSKFSRHVQTRSMTFKAIASRCHARATAPELAASSSSSSSLCWRAGERGGQHGRRRSPLAFSLSLSLVVHGHRENRTGNTLTSAGRVTTPVVGLGTAVQCSQHGSGLGWPGVGLRGTGRAGPGHSYGWAPGNECAPQIVGMEDLLGQLLHWVGSF